MPEPKRPLKVFLCHAHADRDAVRGLYTRLTQDGVDAWLDKAKLLPGQDWELEIRKAVREADVVVVCLSKQFNQAGFRQKEVRLALDTAMEQPEGEIFIIPARLEECGTLESLRKWHWVDLFEVDGYEHLLMAINSQGDERLLDTKTLNSQTSTSESLLPEILERVIDENEMALSLDKNKDDLFTSTRDGIRVGIMQKNAMGVLTLHLLLGEVLIKKVGVEKDMDGGWGEYMGVLWAYINNRNYGDYTVQSGIVSDVSGLVQSKIANFYTSPKSKQALSLILASISKDRIKAAIEAINPDNQTNSEEVASQVRQLLDRYQVIGQEGMLVDEAFRDEVWNILKESGFNVGISVIVAHVTIPYLATIIGAAFGTQVSIPAPILALIPLAVLIRQAAKLKENLSKRVSKDVTDQMSAKFSELNFEMSKKLKSLMIDQIKLLDASTK